MVHCGRAVFEVGDTKKPVTVEFDTIAELREGEDNLTWEHWPQDLQCVSIEYRPSVEQPAVKKVA